MKKYNMIINILFWTLITFISFVAVMSVTTPEQVAGALMVRQQKQHTETQTVKEPMVVSVQKDVEWFYFEATGYSANDPAQGTDDTTYTGLEAEEGMVAVDPEVIPLGTEIVIKDIGTFVAEDIGGKIKGNRIDIFFDSKQDAQAFGREGVWVKIKDQDVRIAQSLP